jgi:hypothetical protein
MTWHPASGIGVVALGNLRYAQVRVPAGEQLRALVRGGAAPSRRVRAGRAVEAFRPVAERLLEGWDDTLADATFAMNMDLDEPRVTRRERVRGLVDGVGGGLRPDPGRPVESDSPADLTWWLRGDRGWVRVSVLVTPEPRPRIQQLDVVAVGDPSPRLRDVAERLLVVAADGTVAWPEDLAAGPDLDREAAVRSLHAVGIRFGAPRLGEPREGDGRSTTTFALETERGRADLRVGVDPETGTVTAAAALVRERLPPAEPW